MSNISCDTKSKYKEEILSENAAMFGSRRSISKPKRFLSVSQKRLWALLQMVMVGGLMFAMCMRSTHDLLVSIGFPVILFVLFALIVSTKLSSLKQSFETSSVKKSTEEMRSSGIRP